MSPFYASTIGRFGDHSDGNTSSINLTMTRRSKELQCACESALEQLKNLLLVASAHGLFQDKPESWMETCTVVGNMSQCSGLIRELFPDRFHNVVAAVESAVSS